MATTTLKAASYQITIATIDSDRDNKPTASGTTTAGLTVLITWPDGSNITTLAKANGSYSVEALTPQSSGVVTAMSFDQTGQASLPTTSRYIDTTPPVAPTVVATDLNLDNIVEAKGFAEAGSTVTITFPSGQTNTGVVNANGKYTIKSLNIETSGTVTAVAVDGSGIISTKSVTRYVDITPPKASTFTATDPDLDNKINVTGKTEPNNTVTVIFPSGQTATVVANANGKYSIESLNIEYTGAVSVVSKDQAGNTSPSTVVQYLGRNQPVALALTVTDPDGDNKINAAGTASPNSTVTIFWPDHSASTTVVNANGNFSIESPTTQLTGLVTAYLADHVGNKSSVSANYIDMTNPSIAITSISDPDLDDKINITGTTEPGLKVTILFPNGETTTTMANSSGVFTTESLTQQTSGLVRATAADLAGNTASDRSTYTVKTVPTIFSFYVDDTYRETSPDNAPMAYGATNPNTKLIVTWPDGDTSTVMSDAQGNYAIESKYDELSGMVTVVAVDAAGNTSITKSDGFVSRPLEPTLFLTSDSGNQGDWATIDTTPTYLIESISSFDTPHLYVDGMEVAATYDAVNHTITPIHDLSRGIHSIQLGFSNGTENGILSAAVHHTTIYHSSLTIETNINPIAAGTLSIVGQTMDVYNADADAEIVSIAVSDLLGQQVYATSTVAADGSWSVSGVNLSSLTNGNIYVNATASDNFGGQVSDTELYNLRTMNPMPT